MILRDLIIASLLQPRLAARQLLDARLPPVVGWSLFGLGIVLSALMGHLATGLMPLPEGVAPIDLSPFALTALQAISQILVLLAAVYLGRFMGGQGRFGDVLVLIAWIEILLVAAQAIDLFLLIALPPLAGVLPLIAVVMMLWIMANFLAEAHGFASAWAVLGAIIGLSMLFGVAFLSALAQLGIQFGAPHV
jgi:hypothetical protein